MDPIVIESAGSTDQGAWNLDRDDPYSDASSWLEPGWAISILDRIASGLVERPERESLNAELTARTQLHVLTKSQQLQSRMAETAAELQRSLAERADATAREMATATRLLAAATVVLALATIALVVTAIVRP